MDKKQVIQILEEIGVLLELKGENQFKTRAYANAARALEGVTEDIAELIAANRLREVRGIGEAIGAKITEVVQTGRLKYYDDLRSSFPPTLLELLRIPGLGAKKAKKLFEELGITSIAELEKACQQNRLVDVPGFGKKSQEKFLEGIRQVRQFSGRHLFHHTLEVATPLFEAVRRHPKVIRAELAGSLRRCKETIKDIDIVASCKDADREVIMKAFAKFPGVISIIAQGETKTSVLLDKGIPADLRLLSDEEYPYLLHHFTGSAEHNVAMRSHALKRGIKMSDYGLFKGNKLIRCKDETEIFAALGMGYIPPELRENMGEIEAALKGEIPALLEKGDLRGVLHCHSTYSDGANSLQEMAEACKKLGFEYLGICDHSMSVAYARGLSPEKVKAQHKEIDKLNAAIKGFRIFKGTECDILRTAS
jgi:DNA polymerase (family 10)